MTTGPSEAPRRQRHPSPAPGGAPARTPTSARHQIPAPHGQQQGAEATLVPGVHVQPSLQQHGDGPSLAGPGGRVQRGLTAEVLQAPVTALGGRRGPSPTETRPGGPGRPRGKDSRQSREVPSTAVRGAGPGKGDPAHPRARMARLVPEGGREAYQLYQHLQGLQLARVGCGTGQAGHQGVPHLIGLLQRAGQQHLRPLPPPRGLRRTHVATAHALTTLPDRAVRMLTPKGGY